MNFLEENPWLVEWGLEIIILTLGSVMTSGWFANQSWKKRKFIQLVVGIITREGEIWVDEFKQSDKDKIKNKIPYDDGVDIRNKVKAKILNEVSFNEPKLKKIQGKFDLDDLIEAEVDRRNKKRRGTKGGLR